MHAEANQTQRANGQTKELSTVMEDTEVSEKGKTNLIIINLPICVQNELCVHTFCINISRI